MLSTQSSQPPSVCHSSDLRVGPSSHSCRTRTENPADHIISLSGYYTVSSRRKTQQTTSSVCQVTTLCRHDGKPSRPHHQPVRLLHCVVTTENPADRIISLSGYYTVSSRRKTQQTTSPVCQVTTLCRHDGKPRRPHHQSVRLLHCVVTNLVKTRRSETLRCH